MKILINTSTLVLTGVTQVAVSFIEECKKIPDLQVYVFISSSVKNNLDIKSFPPNFTFYYIDKHPLYGIGAYFERKRLRKLEKSIKPDCVFSVFGPSWWTPTAPHLQGYAFGHYVNYDSPFFDKLSFKERLRIFIMKTIHVYYLKKNGHYFVTESSFVSDRLAKVLNVSRDHIYTVNNTANSYFLNYKENQKSVKKSNDKFSFYSLCTPQKHKNIQILNEVIPIILKKKEKLRFEFHLTFPQEAYDKMFKDEYKSYIINHGPLKIAECPGFVSKYDALFLPTLVECFSANYPEAMLMGKPILTSNLKFAKSICKDAALYFNPVSPEDIADKIIMIIENEELYHDLRQKGFDRISIFNDPTQRANKYIEICRSIVNE